MKRLATICVIAFFAVLLGCGGGGGSSPGGSTALIGRVLSVVSGGPLNPTATVQAIGGDPQTAANEGDGSFTLSGVPSGTTQVQVLPNQVNWPLFTFVFPAASGSTVVGDLWVGPELVTLKGRVLNSTNSQPILNADVTFGGQNGKTNALGEFSLANVAYASESQAGFWGIVGTARANSFFKTDFSAAPNVKNGANEVNVGDILLTPSNDGTPPGPPYNITGRVLPIGGSSGCIVTLKQGVTELRKFTVANDGKYYFWITPGTYDVTFSKNAQTAPTQQVTVTQPNQPVTVPDVTLN